MNKNVEDLVAKQIPAPEKGRNPVVDWLKGLEAAVWAPSVVSVTVEGSDSIVSNTTYTATVVVKNGASTTVTWSADDDNVATINSTTGLLTVVGDGEVTVTATSTFDPSKSGSKVVTVTI